MGTTSKTPKSGRRKKTKARSSLPKGIQERSGGFRWQVQVGGKRVSGQEASLAEAIVARDNAENALLEGRESFEIFSKRTAEAEGAWSLKRAADLCLRTPGPAGWAGTKGSMTAQTNISYAIRYFGPDKLLSEISYDDIEEFVSYLEGSASDDKGRFRTNTPATINRKLSALSKVMKFSKKRGGLSKLPDFPDRGKESRGRICELSAEEEQEVLEHLTNFGLFEQRDVVQCLIDTGCRPSELWWVLVRDLDFKQGVILIHGRDAKGTKNGEYRSVPMTKRVKDVMIRRASERNPHERVFPFDKEWLRRGWDKARAAMGRSDDPDFIPYICRHTRASRLVRKNVSLQIVKQWMGHKTLEMTSRYSYLLPQDLMGVVGLIDDEGDSAPRQNLSALTNKNDGAKHA